MKTRMPSKKNQLKLEVNSKPSEPGNMPKLKSELPLILKTFLSARLCSALWSFISDCDETYNYWEPLHYLLFGHGFQTWEYSPEFALRSYTYLLFHCVPAWLYTMLFGYNKVLTFYFLRCCIGLACAIVEIQFYQTIVKRLGKQIGMCFAVFQVFSAGMFISSTAFLPSTFSMIFGTAAMNAWWTRKFNLAIFLTAISALLGWPFAAFLGVPIALDMIVRRRLIKDFLTWCLISAVVIIVPMIAIDSWYFGCFTVAPFNIIVYNMFSPHGPNLYGVEPFSFYFVNLFLNFNLIWVYSLLTPFFLCVLPLVGRPFETAKISAIELLTLLSPLYLWLIIFIAQPHKEERFMFPIYPMISLSAAVGLDRMIEFLKIILQKLKWPSDKMNFTTIFLLIIPSIFGISRICSLYRNYHSSLEIFKNLDTLELQKQAEINLCLGKDWHRFQSSFLLPKNFRARFIESDFEGILPAYFAEMDNGTTIIHPYFNNANKKNDAMYFKYEKCNLLLDFDTGRYTSREPKYSARTKEWQFVRSVPYLDVNKSKRWARAFYVPFLSDHHLVFGNITLYQNIRNK